MLLHWQNWKWIQQKGKSPIDAHKWAFWMSSCPSMLFPMTILAHDPILLHLQVWLENKSLLWTNPLAELCFNYSVYDMKWMDSHDALCETFVFVLCGQKGLCQQKLPCTMWTVTWSWPVLLGLHSYSPDWSVLVSTRLK